MECKLARTHLGPYIISGMERALDRPLGLEARLRAGRLGPHRRAVQRRLLGRQGHPDLAGRALLRPLRRPREALCQRRQEGLGHPVHRQARAEDRLWGRLHQAASGGKELRLGQVWRRYSLRWYVRSCFIGSPTLIHTEYTYMIVLTFHFPL